MPKSKTLTKTVAVTETVHETLLKLREAYKLRTVNDVIAKLVIEQAGDRVL
jgi:predicted CopG family antitoxin